MTRMTLNSLIPKSPCVHEFSAGIPVISHTFMHCACDWLFLVLIPIRTVSPSFYEKSSLLIDLIPKWSSFKYSFVFIQISP